MSKTKVAKYRIIVEKLLITLIYHTTSKRKAESFAAYCRDQPWVVSVHVEPIKTKRRLAAGRIERRTK